MSEKEKMFPNYWTNAINSAHGGYNSITIAIALQFSKIFQPAHLMGTAHLTIFQKIFHPAQLIQNECSTIFPT